MRSASCFPCSPGVPVSTPWGGGEALFGDDVVSGEDAHEAVGQLEHVVVQADFGGSGWQGWFKGTQTKGTQHNAAEGWCDNSHMLLSSPLVDWASTTDPPCPTRKGQYSSLVHRDTANMYEV